MRRARRALEVGLIARLRKLPSSDSSQRACSATCSRSSSLLLRLPRRLGQTVDRLETGTLKFGIVPTDLGALEGIFRTTANRLGVALIIAGGLISSALMARVNETVSLIGFAVSVALGL